MAISHLSTEEEEVEATRFDVPAEAVGKRLDQFLAEAMGGDVSRNHVQWIIAGGGVTLADGQTIGQARRKVVAGESFFVVLPEPAEADPRPEAIPLSVLYEDEAVIVIDKPAGMVVHPAAGNWSGTLVNALLHHCRDSLSGVGGVRRPGIVHRLDKDTSGVMVVAKSDVAHTSLAAQFAAHGRDGRMERRYRALVWGVPHRRDGTVDAPLGRSATDRIKRAVVQASRSDARHAVTHYHVEEIFGDDAALVECRLETGRTHQIRVHMAHISHPLLGDPLYGLGFRSKAERLEEPVRTMAMTFPRQALHAGYLAFEHPVTGQAMYFESPLPADIQELVAALRR